MIKFLRLYIFLIVCSQTSLVFAQDQNNQQASQQQESLTPVIPGQRMVIGGKEVRVWSTAGKLPVATLAPVPQAPQASNLSQIQTPIDNTSVIIDRRSKE